ncbi:cytochrome c oxidase subunit 3 [Hyphomicrobium sp.]|uniref:cytochrome c oxidase subunit 3 n=1 Tax=Hyphomicrobium sp. TaxID=82 RepID=UPI002E320D1C|nr:cytochrome c oxidase subunit 3 [Hyphomicrobium sp.]HEX2841164.1 cytochrome c oxidase subunit 3 [Hyphomicrobium sp.]
MTIIVLFLAVVSSIAAWWLWHQGLTSKPWLEEGVIGDARAPGMSTTSPSKVGLGVFLVVASTLFMLLISAYAMRMPARDWLPLPIPKMLWLTTGLLVLSSIALQSALMAARRGSLAGVRGGLVAGGVSALAFLFGQLVAWRQLSTEGFLLAANVANAFFYLMTALHGLHVSGGLVALGRTGAKVWSDDQFELPEITASVELCAIYWHFLLFVWLILFALLMGWGSDFLEICRQVFADP